MIFSDCGNFKVLPRTLPMKALGRDVVLPKNCNIYCCYKSHRCYNTVTLGMKNIASQYPAHIHLDSPYNVYSVIYQMYSNALGFRTNSLSHSVL